MEDLDLNKIERRLGSKYKLVVAVARRAQQLRDGARPLVQCESRNPISIALKEISEREILIDETDLLGPEKEDTGDLAELFASMDDDDMGDLEDFVVGTEDDEDEADLDDEDPDAEDLPEDSEGEGGG